MMVLTAVSNPAFAFKQKETSTTLDERAFVSPALWKTQQSVSIDELMAFASPNLLLDWSRFLSDQGGHWQLMLDRVTGKPSLVEGGVP